MPGILPMKVIKVGTNAQTRIAQACDRCRSKKIRCDGITPCCTQCKNVGFECKTSDKLSRRAFPRGYTESLEERVRALESEVRELKDLLDEKDEKIDLLSRIQSFSHKRRSISSSVSSTASPVTLPIVIPKEEPLDTTFKVQQAPNLQKSEFKSDPYFVGASSTRVFIDTIRSKIQEKGVPLSSIDATALIGRCDLAKPAKRADLAQNISRLASDQLVNVFFQEWAPLFPILHRPTFLNIYSDYINDVDLDQTPVSLAQLYLVLNIAAVAGESSRELLPYLEAQWQEALGHVLNETKLATLQCLVLAQLYCLVRGDKNKVVFYSGLAVCMARRLGLHQNQKRLSLTALTGETRKKVFWTLYTLDVFGAIMLGLPKLLKDEDIETEDPADVDDENVNEQGFQTALPGEFTKLSSALALFRLARVLSRVATQLYPAASTYELSLQTIGTLDAELEEWRSNLAPHLRLEFVKDKPSTNIVSSRCPLLGLFFYYVRLLIHRPVLCSDLVAEARPSILAVAECGKHIIQILQLLQERGLSYTVCINKIGLILACGFGLMYYMSELPENSKLQKDTQQFVAACVELLERTGTPTVISFRRIAQLFQSPPSPSDSSLSGSLQAIDTEMSSIGARRSGTRAQLLDGDISSPTDTLFSNDGLGASIAFPDGLIPNRQVNPNGSFSSTSSEAMVRNTLSTSTLSLTSPTNGSGMPNLDYLSFGSPNSLVTPSNIKSSGDKSTTDWDGLLHSLDPADHAPNRNPDKIISSQRAARHSSNASFEAAPIPAEWNLEWTNPEGWALFDLAPEEQSSSKSVLSFSDESTSGEDMSSCDMGSEFRGYSISHNEFYNTLPQVGSPKSTIA